jgi:hypothetical protein
MMVLSVSDLQKQGLRTQGFGVTERKDAWWNENTFTLLALVLFVIYATWRGLENNFYEVGPYLSPFYSPNLKKLVPGWPLWLSPALFVALFPAGFRGTCYFYRRAVYRAFFGSPPNCGVDTPKSQLTGDYLGEKFFPFVLMNFHRYFLYAALVLVVFHWTHLWDAMWYQGKFGVGVGTLIMGLDTLLLTLYVGSCHSLRHILGGKLNTFVDSAFSRFRFKLWNQQSWFNTHHWFYAWASLGAVGLADWYIRQVASGAIVDLNTWGVPFALHP